MLGRNRLQQYKKTLDPQYKLPRMKYKGEQVASMRIRSEKKALVEEVPEVRRPCR